MLCVAGRPGALDRLVPKLVTTLAGYTREQFLSDLGAGIIVGIVALPLAIAFAIASGVSPERGLFTAIVAGFLISALGGSRVQIGGPTGAFVVIVYAIVQRHGVEGLAMATLMAGVILVGFGLVRLGGAIKFIPYPVTIGFTSGIALIILSGEVKDFLGLEGPVPAEFLGRWRAVAAHSGSLNPWAVAVSLATLAIIVLWPRLNRRIPSPFVALIVTTAVVQLFHLPVDTIGSRFGVINAALPAPALPAVTFHQMPGLAGAAFTIALLGAVESLLSAVVADGMIGGRHRSNMELVAQGIANIASPLFGGIPATGAIARTATNVRNGGRTPIAGITHAVTLLLITLAAAPLAEFIPLATLSAVLMVVAYNMGEWHHFTRLAKWPKSDSAVFLATFALTVLIDLTVAVQVGMVLAAVLFIKRISETTQITAVDETTETEGAHHSLVGKEIPEGVMVYRVFGAFFFGAADKLETALKRARQEPDILILRMRKVLAMDATGLNALEDLYEKL